MKKRVIAAVMMLAMLISAFGITAFAAEVPANGELSMTVSTVDDALQIELSVSGELTEFMYTVEFDTDITDPDETVAYAFHEDFKTFNSSLSKSPQVACGLPVDTANQIVFGGVYGEAATYEGVVATVTVQKDALADSGTISLYNGSTLVETVAYSNTIYGDVNEDGEVTSTDALMALQAVVSLTTLTDSQTKAADVDGNGTVESSDALYILQYVVDLIQVFPVEQ